MDINPKNNFLLEIDMEQITSEEINKLVENNHTGKNADHLKHLYDFRTSNKYYIANHILICEMDMDWCGSDEAEWEIYRGLTELMIILIDAYQIHLYGFTFVPISKCHDY